MKNFLLGVGILVFAWGFTYGANLAFRSTLPVKAKPVKIKKAGPQK